MSTITELKDQINTKTVKMVLIAIASAGIYPILWLYRNFQVIDKITKVRTASDNFVIWIAICAGISGSSVGNSIGHDDTISHTIGIILGIVAGILYIVWAFRARRALQKYTLDEHKIDLQMNRFYTFLFTVYYINYCINDLPEVYRKQQILNDKKEG